jgi:hypothetical protein
MPHGIARRGEQAGQWRRDIRGKSAFIETRLTVALTKTERAALQKAVQDYSHFLGAPVTTL